MPGGAQKRSNSSSYPSTDNPNAHTLSTPSDHAIWSGGQAERAPWFNLKIHEVENDYTLSQLCETGTVLIASRGVVAVFSPSHAAEHAAGAARGTTRRPNTRAREDLTKFRKEADDAERPTPMLPLMPRGMDADVATPTPLWVVRRPGPEGWGICPYP